LPILPRKKIAVHLWQASSVKFHGDCYRHSCLIKCRKCLPQAEGAVSMVKDFVPLHDRILVRRIEERETTKGGLIIPDTAKEKPQDGEVMAVGKGKLKENGTVVPLEVKPGDRVLFGKYSGTDIILDGEEYLIMREDEVLGIHTRAKQRARIPA
jgi:chaperonin GroES